jgi:uncharacterized membrane protein YvbJ
MNCKRCGNPLPSKGYVCSFCGLMLDNKQIDMQKELLKNNTQLKPDLVSEKYGGKSQVFQSREDKPTSYLGIFIIFGILLLIIVIITIVYFL